MQHIYTYELQDLGGEKIDRFFYNEEFVHAGCNQLAWERGFKIERVSRSRCRGASKQLLVKRLGYLEKFKSCINVSDVQAQ